MAETIKLHAFIRADNMKFKTFDAFATFFDNALSFLEGYTEWVDGYISGHMDVDLGQSALKTAKRKRSVMPTNRKEDHGTKKNKETNNHSSVLQSVQRVVDDPTNVGIAEVVKHFMTTKV
jgi:hypothetical protein